MNNKKTGYLVSYVNDNNNRYEIIFYDNSIYRLHCGDVFEIKNKYNNWEFVRIEYDYVEGWYLVTDTGNKDIPFKIIQVRM